MFGWWELDSSMGIKMSDFHSSYLVGKSSILIPIPKKNEHISIPKIQSLLWPSIQILFRFCFQFRLWIKNNEEYDHSDFYSNTSWFWFRSWIKCTFWLRTTNSFLTKTTNQFNLSWKDKTLHESISSATTLTNLRTPWYCFYFLFFFQKSKNWTKLNKCISVKS